MATGVKQPPPPPWEVEKEGGSIPPPPWEEEQKKSSSLSAFQMKAAKRLNDIHSQQIIAQAGEDEAAGYRKAAVTAAEMLPFALAAPFTGGTSLAAGAAISAGAGLAGGIGREAIEAGHKEQTWKGVATSLGVDALTGAAGELGGRAVVSGLVKGIGVGKTLMGKLIMQSAADSSKGLEALQMAGNATRKALYEEGAIIKNVDVSSHLSTAFRDLEAIPTSGKGAYGKEFSKLGSDTGRVKDMLEEHVTAVARKNALVKARPEALSQMADAKTALEQAHGMEGPEFIDAAAKAHAKRLAAVKRMEAIEENLKIVNGQISSHQDFPTLVRMKGQAQQFAYQPGMHPDEAAAWRKLARGLDAEIKTAAGGSETRLGKLYEQSNTLAQVELDRKSLMGLANQKIKQAAASYLRSGGIKMATLGLAGGVGYEKGGLTGAAEGLAAGMAVNALAPKVSTLLLQHMMSSSKAAPLLGQAAKAFSMGKKGLSDELFASALSAVGGRETMRKAFDFYVDHLRGAASQKQSAEGPGAGPPAATAGQ